MLFPTVGCMTNTTFSETLNAPKRYLGGQSLETKGKGEISVLYKTENDYRTFLDWYYNGINNGTDNFDIHYSFWGVLRYWDVKITGEIKVKLADKNGPARLVTIPITFQEDISNYV
jgi:hypothetical protein